MTARRGADIATAAALGAALLAVALHAGLIPAATWGLDEFDTFVRLRAGGAGTFLSRLVDWSPRPVSEGLLWAYSLVVDATGRQLMVPFLALLWGALAVAALAGIGRLRSASAWLAAASVVALILLGQSIGEAFYWPMAAAAYLPTLAGTVFVVLRIAGGGPTTRAGRIACLTALAIAAGSSEIGIVFTAALCVMLLPRERSAWLIVPLVVATVLGLLLLNGRLPKDTVMGIGPTITFHRPWASLAAATRRFVAELSSTVRLTDLRGAIAERLDRLCFVLGVALCLRRIGGPAASGPRLRALFVALLAAAFASLMAAFHQFGVLCCARHAAMRGSFIVLLLVVLGATVSRLPPLDRLPPRAAALAGPGLLAIAIVWPLAARVPALAADYRAMSARIEIRDADWRAGRSAVPGPFAFRMLRAGRIVDGFDVPTGTFRADATPPPPWTALALMDYFGRPDITVTPAP